MLSKAATSLSGNRRRRAAGAGGLALLGCDGLACNGDALRASVLTFAARAGGPEFAAWVSVHCGFPNAILDRFAPVPSPEDGDRLCDDFGVVDAVGVVHEDHCLWVVEDAFPAGRPDWPSATFVEDARPFDALRGVLLAGWQAVAYLALLRGYRTAHRALGDAALRPATKKTTSSSAGRRYLL